MPSRQPHLYCVLLLLILPPVSHCQVNVVPYEAEIARNDKYNVVLGFDLRNDNEPSCGLSIREAPNTDRKYDQRAIVLPFETSDAGRTADVVTTWGTVGNCCTVIAYFQSPETARNFSIGLKPVFDPQPETPIDPISSSGKLYFARYGLEREFIYKYGDTESDTHYAKLLNFSSVAVPDAIAVALPKLAQGKEVRRGRTSLPDFESENDFARFYPSTAAAAKNPYLEIRYVLPLSTSQELLYKILVKLFETIAIPIATLIYLNVQKPRQRRLRIILIVIGISVEIVVFGWILLGFWHTRESQGLEAVLTASVTGIGALLAAVLLWMKRGQPSADEI